MTDTTVPSRAFKPSPTLLICMVAALVAAVGLFIPSLSPVTTSQAAPVPAPESAAPDGATATIQIVDFGYAGDLVVQAGSTVQVINDDGVPHTLTAVDGSVDTGVIGGNGTGTFLAPNADGVIDFICTIHPSMTGQLTVSS